MPDMAATLTKFSQNGNSVTYTVNGHTVQKPKLLLQKRKIPSASATAVSSIETSVVYGSEDASGALLPSRVMITITARRPVAAIQADVDGAIALCRDFIASDDFTQAINSQLFAAG